MASREEVAPRWDRQGWGGDDSLRLSQYRRSEICVGWRGRRDIGVAGIGVRLKGGGNWREEVGWEWGRRGRRGGSGVEGRNGVRARGAGAPRPAPCLG